MAILQFDRAFAGPDFSYIAPGKGQPFQKNNLIVNGPAIDSRPAGSGRRYGKVVYGHGTSRLGNYVRGTGEVRGGTAGIASCAVVGVLERSRPCNRYGGSANASN